MLELIRLTRMRFGISLRFMKMGMKEKAEEALRHYHEMTDCSFRNSGTV
jgi:hypothetical protein